MPEPGIGTLVPIEDAHLCMYTGPTPDGPECRQPATVHVAAAHPDDGHFVGMPACDQHADVARSIAGYLSEHPHRGWCGFPGSVWDEPEKRCVLDDGGTPHAASADQAALTHA